MFNNEFSSDFGFENSDTAVDSPKTPRPLPMYSNHLPPLDPAMLPNGILKRCLDVSDRSQSALEYAVTAEITAIAGVLGNKIVMFPKQFDDWAVPACMWSMIVGDSGSIKSQIQKDILSAATNIDKALKANFKMDQAKHKKSVKALEKRLDVLIKNQGSQLDMDVIQDQLDELAATVPVEKQFIVNDFTIEVLQLVLARNPEGVMLVLDEIASLYATIERLGRENDRTFLLQVWNGMDGYYVQRMSRENVDIEKMCMSIVGGIQSDKLRRCMRQSSDKHGDDGFFQRFQLVFFPELGDWNLVDRKVNQQAKANSQAVIEFLKDWNPNYNNNPYRNEAGALGLSFDDEAQPLFFEFYKDLMNRLRKKQIPNEQLALHLNKYSSLVPKLATIFHCADNALSGLIPPKVNKLNTLRAISMTTLLEKHAEKLYNVNKYGGENDTNIALILLEKIRTGSFKSGITVAKIVKAGWSGCNDKDDVQSALELLDDYGWGKLEAKGGANRPSMVFNIEPKAKTLLKDRKNYIVEVPADPQKLPWLERLQGHILTMAVQEANASVAAKPVVTPVFLDEIDVAALKVDADVLEVETSAPAFNVSNWFNSVNMSEEEFSRS